MDFSTGKELLALCTEKNKPISEIMLVREIAKFGVGREAVWERMRKSLAVMREGVGRSQTEQMNLLGGYIGGESKALLGRIRREGAMGGMISRASAYAMGVIELNASMGRIVPRRRRVPQGCCRGYWLPPTKSMISERKS